MNFFKKLFTIIAGVSNFLTPAFAKNHEVLSVTDSLKNLESTDYAQDKLETLKINLNELNTSVENVEKFMKQVNLNYEIKSFDGDSLEIQLPYRDKIILAAQIWADK